MGSLLPGSRTERRTPAMSLGGTRTTASPGAEQVALEPAGQVPAVLERETALRASAPPSGGARGGPSGVAATVLSPSRRALLVDGHQGVGALVQSRRR